MKFFKQLFCGHKIEKYLGFDYYNPIEHGLKRPKYECKRCGKIRFKKHVIIPIEELTEEIGEYVKFMKSWAEFNKERSNENK